MVKVLFRYLGETFVVIVFVGIGSILGFILYGTRLQILLHLFAGPVLFVLRSGRLRPWIRHQSSQMFHGGPMGMDSANDLGVLCGHP
jgi:hypothetical protein